MRICIVCTYHACVIIIFIHQYGVIENKRKMCNINDKNNANEMLVPKLAYRTCKRVLRVCLHAASLSHNHSGQVLARVSLSPSSIIWYRSQGGDFMRLRR